MQEIVPGAVAVARWNSPQNQQTMLRCLVLPPSSRDCPSLWFSRHYAGLEVAAQMRKDLNIQPQFLLKDNAWIAYFTIASMAYNLLTALRIILMPNARWTAREIISGLITTPLPAVSF
jgi:hypothetical protein